LQLKNLSKKTILCLDLKEAKSAADKFFGLLIKTNPRALIFKTRFGIHTFFLKKPIDVLVLNAANEVVKAQTVKPNWIFVYDPKYLTVIELPQGTIKDTKTKVGDRLQIKTNQSRADRQKR